MADDRYSWLDEQAAELLLRGEPADAVVGADDERVLAEAERLSAALTEVSRTALGDFSTEGELCGEAAALAAFRQARTGASRAGSTRDAVQASPHDEQASSAGTASSPTPTSTGGAPALAVSAPGSVRIGRGTRHPRLRRPLKAGLAAALAGCVLGGVAVAAGAGVLPAPFGGGGGEPAPAHSVSAAVTPGPQASSSASAGTGRSSGAPDETAAGDDPGTGDARGTDGGTPSEGGRRSESAGPDVGVSGAELGLPGTGTNKPEAPLQLCRKHQAGTLDADSKQRLARLAGGAKSVDRYCGRLLDSKGDGKGRSGDDGDRGGDNGGATGGGNDDGGNDDGAGDRQLLPPTVAPQVSPSVGAAG